MMSPESIGRGRRIAESMMDRATAEHQSGMVHAPARIAADGLPADSSSTGGPKAQNPAQALQDPNQWTIALQPTPDFEPAFIPNEAMPPLAGFVNALKAQHDREAAASLRTIADARLATAPDALAYARAEGIAEAARLLDSVARDLSDPEEDR